jgi:DNA (cytosine-5)-methyltransferase 1
MGVPQRRERVFFIALRKDLAKPFLYQKDLFTVAPKLDLIFNEKAITYRQIEEKEAPEEHLSHSISKLWHEAKEGQNFSEVHPKGHFFNLIKVDRDKVLPTISAHHDGGCYHHIIHRKLSKRENCLGGSYPLDYNFLELKHKYLIGMSVPPVMIAQIATEIYNQWLKYI